MENRKNIKSFVFFISMFLLILLGVYLRTKAYIFNKPLWLDESFLFQSMSKEYYEFFGELCCNQSAPPLFMFVEKFLVDRFGIKEYVLRAFPFICSVISVPVFYYFSKIFLKKISIAAAMFLFAVNYQLIYYGTEMKQYSSDVLCFMLLFIILNNLSIKNFKKIHVICYSVLIMLPPLFSIPSYFIIGAWFLRELITSKNDWKKLIAAYIPLGIMSVFYCIYTIIPQYKSVLPAYMSSFSYVGFLSFNIKSDIVLLLSNLRFIFEPCLNTSVYLLLMFIGIFMFVKNYKQKENILLIFALIIPFIFSALKIYPVYERVYLYAAPFLMVLLVKIADILTKSKVALICALMIFLFFFKQYDLYYVKEGFLPKYYSDARTLMQIMISNYNKNDVVIIGACSDTEYMYYKIYYGFTPEKEIFIPFEVLEKNEYEKYLDDVTEPKKSYIFFNAVDYSDKENETKSVNEWIYCHKVIYEKIVLVVDGRSRIVYFRT